MTALLVPPFKCAPITNYSLNAKQIEALKPSSPTFTAKQVSELAKVPLAKVYSLKKQLTEGFHFVETRSTSNTKLISFTASGLSGIELNYWLKIAKSENWSQPRLDAFKLASLWLEVTA